MRYRTVEITEELQGGKRAVGTVEALDVSPRGDGPTYVPVAIYSGPLVDDPSGDWPGGWRPEFRRDVRPDLWREVVSPPGSLARRLQRLLRRRKANQAEVAASAAMTRQQVSRIVTGSNANPSILTVERMVESIGATMAELYAEGD